MEKQQEKIVNSKWLFSLLETFVEIQVTIAALAQPARLSVRAAGSLDCAGAAAALVGGIRPRQSRRSLDTRKQATTAESS